MQTIEVKITKWEKYQLRKDIKSPWWFATNNELWRSSEFSLLNAEEKVVWYALLAIASKEQKPIIRFELAWFSKSAGVSDDSVLSGIQKAKDNNWLTIIRTESVQNPYGIRTAHNITEHNKTKQNNTKQLITKDTDAKRRMSLIADNSKIDSGKVIASYCTAYQARYQARPEIDGKTIGLVKGLLKTHSPEKLSDLIQVYCQMNDPWFLKKCHDFSTFRENLTKVSAAMQTGKDLGAPEKKKTWQDLVDEEEAKNGQKPI